MKNFSSHPSTFTFRTENFGKRLLEKKLKAKKVPHPIKIKEYLGGKREITLKKFGKRFPNYFCVQREIIFFNSSLMCAGYKAGHVPHINFKVRNS
jgi:hypothetical protein